MESQSRYSIVERLTKQKLDIMGAKHSLKDEVTKAEQIYTNAESGNDLRKKEIDAEAEREKAQLDKELLTYKQRAQNLKDRLKDKETMYDEKLAAVNEALKKIEDISSSAAQLSQS